jgi:RNA polymerase sigma factor (sigma-70 family)
MSRIDDELDALRQECEAETNRLQAWRGWRLLDRAVWAGRAAELAAGAQVAPRRAVFHVYVRALHAACSGAEGAARQNRGYAELFQYLYDSARRRYPTIAEDAAQRAVERTFTDFGRCRAPGAFLAFAAQQLLLAARALRQQERPYARQIDSYDLIAAQPDQRQADLAASIITAELGSRFEHLTGEFLAKHPRSARQLDALRLKYIDGLDDAAIGRRLGTTVSNIYVLRSRAIEKLREEPAWRALAAEFGILAEDM